MPKPRVVHGEIELPTNASRFTPARIVVVLDDISRADAPSLEVKRLLIAPKTLAGGDLISFSIEVPAGLLDDRSLYSVRAHIDLSGSGEIERGDYVSMQTYPVITRGYADRVRVAVRRV